MTFKYSKQQQQDITLLDVHPMPDWDEFNEFVEFFIQQENAKLNGSDYGMDRHQVRFEQGGGRYLLQYEHYSQSIWIEKEH